jgi:DNA replicative helicase MCM subunit Mcm2 (Cdc46/Mcm family)
MIQIKDIVKKLKKKHPKGVPFIKICKEADKIDLNSDFVEIALDKLKNAEELYEPVTGRFDLLKG